jgi:hypothetical protein
MTDPENLLDITVAVHLTVDASEWSEWADSSSKRIPDEEIAEDVAKDVDIAVRRELRDIVTDFAGYEVVLCERQRSAT